MFGDQAVKSEHRNKSKHTLLGSKVRFNPFAWISDSNNLFEEIDLIIINPTTSHTVTCALLFACLAWSSSRSSLVPCQPAPPQSQSRPWCPICWQRSASLWVWELGLRLESITARPPARCRVGMLGPSWSNVRVARINRAGKLAILPLIAFRCWTGGSSLMIWSRLGACHFSDKGWVIGELWRALAPSVQQPTIVLTD